MTDVLVVERSVDFVEQAERARLRQENSEKKRERNERLLAARQKMDALRALAARRCMDLDISLEGTLGVLQPQVALTAAEQSHEDISEVFAYLHEGLQKEVTRGRIDFANRLLQRSLR
jgi:hypothetical protein